MTYKGERHTLGIDRQWEMVDSGTTRWMMMIDNGKLDTMRDER